MLHNIEELTLKQLRELSEMFPSGGTNRKQYAATSITVGRKYLIRTVTMYYTGEVICITDSDIVLSNAAWIADTGCYSEALTNGPGVFNEVEPYPGNVIVSRACIVDAALWSHDLPRDKK